MSKEETKAVCKCGRKLNPSELLIATAYYPNYMHKKTNVRVAYTYELFRCSKCGALVYIGKTNIDELKPIIVEITKKYYYALVEIALCLYSQKLINFDKIPNVSGSYVA